MLIHGADVDGVPDTDNGLDNDEFISREAVPDSGFFENVVSDSAKSFFELLYDKYYEPSDAEFFAENESESDLALVELAQGGDREALDGIIRKYLPLVLSSCKDRYLPGAGFEDLMQEGLIGVVSAVNSFNKESCRCFTAFVSLCVKRRIDTAVKSANRKKHTPLNTYLSLQSSAGNDDGNLLEEELVDVNAAEDNMTPEDILLREEDEERMHRQLEAILSEMELKVLECILDGMSYCEISQQLCISEKSVDNARQRIKSKLLRSKFGEGALA